MFVHTCEGQRSVQVCVPQKPFTLVVFIYCCVCERHVYVSICVILCGQSGQFFGVISLSIFSRVPGINLKSKQFPPGAVMPAPILGFLVKKGFVYLFLFYMWALSWLVLCVNVTKSGVIRGEGASVESQL